MCRTIYFCEIFDKFATSKLFTGTGTMLSSYGPRGSANGSDREGAVFEFTESNVTLRVGISFISSAKACRLVHMEILTETCLQDLGLFQGPD